MPAQPKRESETVNTTINSIILPFIHAEGDDINASFDKIEREYELEQQLAQARADHEKTRAELQQQISAVQRVQSERQIEIALRKYPITPAAAKTVTELLLRGGELEIGPNGKLREKTGMRDVDEVLSDLMKENPNFIPNGNAQSAPPPLDKRTMTPKQIADYVEAHGQDAFHALPRSPDPRQRKK
jgi:hypothetical protein